jgi:hypothetical protein
VPGVSDSGAAARTSRRIWVFRGCALLLALLVGAGLAELVTRAIAPTPLVQRVEGHGLHVVDGAPVWGQITDREHRDCVERHPGRVRIAFFGSWCHRATDRRWCSGKTGSSGSISR